MTFIALLALVGVPAASAAPWLQAGYDAASTGATADPGPSINETAFRVELPGEITHHNWIGDGFSAAEPLIRGGQRVHPCGA